MMNPGTGTEVAPCGEDGTFTVDVVIFDVDGTLVDTNETHVEPWRDA